MTHLLPPSGGCGCSGAGDSGAGCLDVSAVGEESDTVLGTGSSETSVLVFGASSWLRGGDTSRLFLLLPSVSGIPVGGCRWRVKLARTMAAMLVGSEREVLAPGVERPGADELDEVDNPVAGPCGTSTWNAETNGAKLPSGLCRRREL